MKLSFRRINPFILFVLITFPRCIIDDSIVITTVAVTEVTSNSARSGGEISCENEPTIIEKGVCWSKSPGATIQDKKTSDGSGRNDFVSVINGLEYNTEYFLRAYATSESETVYGDEISFTTIPSTDNQIIADHNIVDDFDRIPEEYMAEVKKMLLCILGESHARAYRAGLELLEAQYPEYACNLDEGEAFTSQHLRVNTKPVIGEKEWFTWYAFPQESRPYYSQFIKELIKEYHEDGHPISVLGFGWCWDMVATYESNDADEIYGCHWFGRSDGGPDGNLCWGLNADDYPLTQNAVSLDTYLEATEDYISYCKANGYDTKVIFTTGPVDNWKEGSYQVFIKHGYIRNYVKSDSTRILFDYADILCYDDDGTITTSSWNDHEYPYLSNINLGDESIGHISPEGAIRLAKAQWWMLARIAGWDGK